MKADGTERLILRCIETIEKIEKIEKIVFPIIFS